MNYLLPRPKGPQVHAPRYAIFSGRFGSEDILWKEHSEALENALSRMHQLAAESPGAYFVFDCVAYKVRATIDATHI